MLRQDEALDNWEIQPSAFSSAEITLGTRVKAVDYRKNKFEFGTIEAIDSVHKR
jgi:hypothetical protein